MAPSDQPDRPVPVLPQRPVLPGFFRVIPMGPDSLQLRSAGRVIRLAAPGFGTIGPRLLAHLDGHSTVNELAARIPIDRSVLDDLLNRLSHDGVLLDGANGGAPAGGNLAVAEFHGVLGAAGHDIQAALATARVLLFGLGPAARTAVAHLAGFGVGTMVLADAGRITEMDQAVVPGMSTDVGRPRSWVVAEECLRWARIAGDGASRTTVVMEGPGPIDEILERSGPFNLVMVEVDESAERATAANTVCLGAGITALFHELTTLGGVVGPTIGSFTTSCYECLMTRHSSHLRFYDEHVASVRSLRSGEVQVRQPAILAGGAAMTGGILSLEAMRLLTGTPPPATTDAILRADFRTLQVRREPLLGVPGCPACGPEAEVLLGR